MGAITCNPLPPVNVGHDSYPSLSSRVRKERAVSTTRAVPFQNVWSCHSSAGVEHKVLSPGEFPVGADSSSRPSKNDFEWVGDEQHRFADAHRHARSIQDRVFADSFVALQHAKSDFFKSLLGLPPTQRGGRA